MDKPKQWRNIELFGKNKIRRNSSLIALIQRRDVKTLAWQAAARKDGRVVIVPSDGGSHYLVVNVTKNLLRGKKPDIVIIRYLNDLPQIHKMIVVVCLDYLLIIIARAFGIKLFWLCHNVDCETFKNFPKISNFRRNLFAKKADKVFVTHKVLLAKFHSVFPDRSDYPRVLPLGPLDSKTLKMFGLQSADPIIDEKIYTHMRNFYLKEKAQGRTVLLWIGTLYPKKARAFEEVAMYFSKKSSEDTCGLSFLFVGEVVSEVKQMGLRKFEDVVESEHIMCLDERVDVPADKWRELADFVWEVCDDASLPLTFLNCRSVQMPMVTLKGTVLHEILSHDGGGVAVETLEELEKGCLGNDSDGHVWPFPVSGDLWVKAVQIIYSSYDELVEDSHK